MLEIIFMSGVGVFLSSCRRNPASRDGPLRRIRFRIKSAMTSVDARNSPPAHLYKFHETLYLRLKKIIARGYDCCIQVTVSRRPYGVKCKRIIRLLGRAMRVAKHVHFAKNIVILIDIYWKYCLHNSTLS